MRPAGCAAAAFASRVRPGLVLSCSRAMIGDAGIFRVNETPRERQSTARLRMRTFYCYFLLLLLGSETILGAASAPFTYQGHLLNQGFPANGSYEFRFTLFDALTSGDAVASPITNSVVTVSNGLF